jgi:hypothetical protein
MTEVLEPLPVRKMVVERTPTVKGLPGERALVRTPLDATSPEPRRRRRTTRGAWGMGHGAWGMGARGHLQDRVWGGDVRGDLRASTEVQLERPP